MFCVCDWFKKKLVPLSQPIRYQTQANRDLIARVFPRLTTVACWVTCTYFEFFPFLKSLFWLARMITFVLALWNALFEEIKTLNVDIKRESTRVYVTLDEYTLDEFERWPILLTPGHKYSFLLFYSKASPPPTAILALRQASASRVIPFVEIGHEIAAMVGEPRTAYPRETPQREQFILPGSNTGEWVSWLSPPQRLLQLRNGEKTGKSERENGELKNRGARGTAFISLLPSSRALYSLSPFPSLPERRKRPLRRREVSSYYHYYVACLINCQQNRVSFTKSIARGCAAFDEITETCISF